MGLTGNWDGRISRRTLLRAGGSAGAAYVLLGRSARSAKAAPPFAEYPFTLGVASGDPTPDGVVLWTRLAPQPLTGGGLPEEIFGVRYEVALDEGFSQIVRRGAVEARPDEVHTVHAEIAGLDPATTYWYRFKWGTSESPVGRTRTAPPQGALAPLRFAFASCQNYTHGYYAAYGDMAEQELDLVVHLGDYIYEGPGDHPARVREHVPDAELFTLSDYRTRHAQYRTDTKLQAAHAAFPFLMTWDDHEFKNNYADLDLDDPDVPLETAAERRAAAYLAYWEHSPLARARKPVGPDMPLYRRAQWGALATFHVLDTRQYRSDQFAQCAPAQRDPYGYCAPAHDPARSILGAEQRDWLLEGLAGSGAAWNVLANQIAFAPRDNDPGVLRRFPPQGWDGYVRDRQLVLDFLAERGLANTVVITGDAHENSVRNVPPDYRSFEGDPRATEFLGTSISTEGHTPQPPSGPGSQNPHILFTDRHRGYCIASVTPGLWTTTFRVLDDVRLENSPSSDLATFVVQNGEPGAIAL